MKAVSSLLREAKTWWLQRFAARRARLTLDRPIISFTFDDVPLSAYAHGLPLLNGRGIKATFYVCLAIDTPPARDHLGATELARLQADGHEIGCHTFTHYRLSRGTVDGMYNDAWRNRAALAALGLQPRAFSFPFGDLSFAAKRTLSRHYLTLRSTRPGINSGKVDLNCLKAVPLYEQRTSPALIERWLDRAAAEPGWLIFYTHGVTDSPTEFDISPATFAHVLDSCISRGWPILPIGAAAEAAFSQRS